MTGVSLSVLLVSQPVEYGVAVCVRQLAAAAVAAGHEVAVACPGPDHGPLAKWVSDAGATHLPLDLERQPGPQDFGALATLRTMMRGRDVVHLHSSKAGALGRMAARLMPKRERPVVLFTPHYWSWQVGGGLAGAYRVVERTLAPLSDAIVAVSEQEAEEGREVLGKASDRIVVIPNGVDRDQFSPSGNTSSRDPESPLIVCVGRLSRQKGQDLAIEALAQLETPAARLRFVGDENPIGEKNALEELGASLGVTSRLEWAGKVDDPGPEFRAADIVISPSRWEGMSLVFLEAMACGRPVIVSDVFGSNAVRSAGVVVEPENPAALSRAIDGLLGDEKRRTELGELARKKSADYDVATTVATNLRLWETLTDQAETVL